MIELERVKVLSQDYAVLQEVSVRFPRGRSTVVMGPSGCGKSTLLKVAAGLLVPESGHVLLEGEDMLRFSEKKRQAFCRRSGFVFQDAALWGNQSIFDNLGLPVRFHNPQLAPDEIRHRVMSTLAGLGLESQAHLRPSQLSSGERKQVSFLRGIILEPELIFLDEPTASIDHAVLEKMLRMIHDLKDRGCTIIAVTHDSGLTSMIADTLVVMKNGRVLEAGDFNDVRRSENPLVIATLSEVLSKAASYDTDLLDLLGGN